MVKLEKLIRFGLYAFIFLLPWQTRLIWQDAFLNGFVWEYGRFSLYGTELLLWVTMLLYGVWLLRAKKISQVRWGSLFEKTKEPATMVYWLVVAFTLVAGLSVTWALNADLAYLRWFTLLEAVAVFSMLLLLRIKLFEVAVVWVGSAIVQAVFATYQFFTQYTFANKWLGMAYHDPLLGGSIILQSANERWLRAYGSLPHPNVLAGFLVIGLLFSIYLAFVAKNRAQRALAAVGVVTITPALFFSFSRSAWVGLIVALVLLLLWFSRSAQKTLPTKRVYLQVLLLVLLIVSVLGSTLSEALVTRLRGVEPLEVSSITLRFTFTEQALQVFQHDPFFGVGIGNYTLGVFQIINATWPGYYYQPVHNVYLLVLAELGIIGSILFFIIIARLLLWAMQSSASIEKTITSLSLIAILVMGVFDHFFWSSFFGVMIFWIIVALNVQQLKAAERLPRKFFW